MATIVNPLIMMNMLIALMNDTYAKIQEDSQIADFIEMAQFILEFESILVWRRGDGKKKFFQLCSVDEQEEENEGSYEDLVHEKVELMAQRIAGIRSHVVVAESRDKEFLEVMQSNVDRLGEKFKSKIEEFEKRLSADRQEIIDEIEKLLTL